MDGLIIDEPYLADILRGAKTWEMRSQITNKRGRIALIRKGSGQIVGYADLVDVLPPLNSSNYSDFFDKHRVPEAVWHREGFKSYIPWVLKNAEKLDRPITYKHKSGAVTWVKLDGASNKSEDKPIYTSAPVTHNRSSASAPFHVKRVAGWRTLIATCMILIAMISLLVVIVSAPLAIIGGVFNAKVFLTCLVGGGLCGGLAGLFDPTFEIKSP